MPKKIQDERITSLVNQYTSHAFYIIFIYTLMASLLKLYVFNTHIFEWFDQFVIVMIGALYITYRLIQSGIQTIPNSQSSQLRLLISSLMGALVFGSIMFIFNYQDLEEITTESILKLSLEIIVITFMWGLSFYFLSKWMAKKADQNAKKLMDDD